MAIDAARLREHCIYEAKAPLGSVLEDLDQIAGVVRDIKAVRRTLFRAAIPLLVVGLIGMIVCGVLGSGILMVCAAVPLFITGAGLLIYSFVYARQINKNCARCAPLKELVKTLQHDAEAKAPFSVKLALKAQPELLREEAWTARKSGKQQFFKDAWLSIQGELMDGTVLSHGVADLIRKRTFTNPRGKRKTKTRTQYLLTVRFAYPPDLYGDVQPVQQGLREQIRVPASARVRDVQASAKAIDVKAIAAQDRSIVETSASLWLGVYRILNLSRRVAAQGGKS